VPYREDPIFRLQVPETCPGVDVGVLKPEDSWQDKQAYRSKALELAARFHEAFARTVGDSEPELADAGPIRAA